MKLKEIKKQIKEMTLTEIDDLLLFINSDFSRRISELYNRRKEVKDVRNKEQIE